MTRILLLALLTSAWAWAAPNFPLSWPVPAGFRSETLAFPLSFAPALDFEGVEEIRFSPGFAKRSAPDYFTYSFVWYVKHGPVVDASSLEGALEMYFEGLMKSVAKKSDYPTTVKILPAQGEANHTLQVDTWDAFHTKRPLRLLVDVYELSSPRAELDQSRVFYFEASPKLRDESVKQLLTPLRTSLELQ